MVKVGEGQCGVCQHFGREKGQEIEPRLLEVLSTRFAAEDLIAACGHEKLSCFSLQVTAASGCNEWEQAH